MKNQDRISLAIQAETPDANGKRWVHLLPVGTHYARDGRGPWIVEKLDAIIQASRSAMGKREMVLDYEHQTDLAPENGQPAPAAGWIVGLQARTDGIWGLVEFTAKASDHIAQREYRYISPVFRLDIAGNVTALLRASLTNNPALDQLTALATLKENTMEFDLAEVRKLLNLAADADGPTILEAIRTLLSNKAGAVPDPAQFVPIGDFERAVAEANKMRQGVSRQAAEIHVNAAVSDGKLIPALREWAITLCTVNKEGFDSFLGRTAGGVQRLFDSPFNSKGRPNVDSPLDEREQEIAARMGLSPTEFAANRDGRANR